MCTLYARVYFRNTLISHALMRSVDQGHRRSHVPKETLSRIVTFALNNNKTLNTVHNEPVRDFGTCRMCEHRRLRRAFANAQCRQSSLLEHKGVGT